MSSSPDGTAGQDVAELVGRAARNMARWHATSVEALGHASTWWPGAWATAGAVPGLYLNAIVFEPGELEHLTSFMSDYPPTRPLALADGTNQLDLAPLGLARGRRQACFWRAPSSAGEPPLPAELDIIEVRSAEVLADFEATSVIGFEASGVQRFAWHAPGVLSEPRFRLWLGNVDGQNVGAAMAYVDDDLIGIYGVTVVPSARRRGYGAALTWRAVRARPELPAALHPSAMATPTYQRLGFARIGQFSGWHRTSRP